MTTGRTRSILIGALTAGMLLAGPLAANAAPGQVPFSALYEGAQVPSTKAELVRFASVLANAPVYSEPISTNLAYHLPKTAAAGEADDRIRVSEPFTANGEEWVAIQVPDVAHGTDTAKSKLTEPGVAYIRAGAVTTNYPWLWEGPKGNAYPSTKADLVTTASLAVASDMYRQPTASFQHALNAPTNKWGETLKSSEIFTYEGSQWIAVAAQESVVPGGVAYMLADPKFVTVAPVEAQPSATASAAPSAGQAPSSSAAAAAPAAPDAPTPSAPQPNHVAEAANKALGNLPAVLFAALVMAGTLFILKRRTV